MLATVVEKNKQERAMTQEVMIVGLSAIEPVIGSGIGILKKPSAAYIHNMLYFAAGIMSAIPL
jgi:hypothetical protein